MFDGHETGLWLLRARVEGRGDVLTFFFTSIGQAVVVRQRFKHFLYVEVWIS